jgi:uncharacterized membrane protein
MHKRFHQQPHSRLIISILLGILAAFILPVHLRNITKVLIGWNVSVWAYLMMMAWLMLRADHVQVIRIANQENERGVVILTMLSIAAVASLAAIVMEFSTTKQLNNLKLLHYLFTFSTILGSWSFVSTMFAIHYAHLYYRMPAKPRPLNFPNEDLPDYWDFLYFSFTISVAAQTSDVSVTNRSMRKVVLFQSILSFIFNAAIIGLCINIAASFIN